MPFLPATLAYPEAEAPKLEALRLLFQDWMQASIQSEPEMKEFIEGMVFDGFYPHYFSRRPRILFIGREALDIEGCNNLDVLHAAYSTGKRIGSRHLNCDRFHSRMLCTAYGILKGGPEWENIPDASVIGDTFATLDGISFAFMNLSKFSNESGFWQSNWKMIQDAARLATQTRKFIAEEIAILQPDIVITMNLEDFFDSLGEAVAPLESTSRAVKVWRLESHGHKSLLLDCFHFSAWNKRDPEHFYLPIRDAVRRHLP